MGAVTRVAEIAIWSVHDLIARMPRDFIFQGSNDGTTWTDIKTFTGITGWTASTATTFDLS